MSLLKFFNNTLGFGSPDKVQAQGQSQQLTNQMNLMREMINQYGNESTSDRLYDIARNRGEADAYRQAQQTGQQMMRAMNSRGVLRSGMTGQNMASIYSQAAQNAADNSAQLEQQKIQDQDRRKLTAMQALMQMLGIETNQDQFTRNLNAGIAQGNAQRSQNSLMNFGNMLGQVGGGIGYYFGKKK